MWDWSKLSIVRGDITKQKADVIVNAANVSLLGGGGVDGAIHKAAGPELLKECKKFHGCPTGEARVTKAYNLNAEYIIHTPGPIWRGGFFDEESLLRKSYVSSLKKAIELKVKSIAFPSISTGGHKFPLDTASEIALNTISEFLNSEENEIENIYIVCKSEDTFNQYEESKRKLVG
ncbi:macro domain-containing protein [Ilyobacter polytropus]|uniref:Appr-1-p processing domain protein n=1 Tax=Ilyobacter polytropus (strain ATCC 51220 / DSM 2926 / LMG 16218 / CuHBu1) TaxID=572544 RepID=E3HD21_ILYPC|nr:macro domain-containing protein [Ilyobacter polytropus]ADO84497.1 Appr-1-p processing domain protein [Ilyobacter polytropus DSM 2926]